MPRVRTLTVNREFYKIVWISDNRDQEAIDMAMDKEYLKAAQEICQVADNVPLVWVRA